MEMGRGCQKKRGDSLSRNASTDSRGSVGGWTQAPAAAGEKLRELHLHPTPFHRAFQSFPGKEEVQMQLGLLSADLETETVCHIGVTQYNYKVLKMREGGRGERTKGAAL